MIEIALLEATNSIADDEPEMGAFHDLYQPQREAYLRAQIALIQPKYICALGRIAAHWLLKTDATLGAMRADMHTYEGIPVVVTYHPAYLLRSLPEKAKAWEDLVFARRTLAAA